MSRYRFDPQALLLSSHDMDGIEFAALDELKPNFGDGLKDQAAAWA
jgi:hypothetical protein